MSEPYRVKLIRPNIDYMNDVQDIPRAFSPYLEIEENSENYLKWEFSYEDEMFTVSVESDLFGVLKESQKISISDDLVYKKLSKRFAKNVLYRFLSERIGIILPYGSLTGVRPTKLYYEVNREGGIPNKHLKENFQMSDEKIALISDCVRTQAGNINTDFSNVILFVNIPFCPTRCAYCSFISTEVFRVKKELSKYVEFVKKEIEEIFRIIDKNQQKLMSVYVGGGTPTAIGTEFLGEILQPLSGRAKELTVEAGRPDTLTEEMLKCLKEYGVTRISVNPQTLHDSTLARIGRAHTVTDFFRSYALAKQYDFTINVDLIAGLPGENPELFRESLDGVLALSPENITVHSFSIKRGADYALTGIKKEEFGAWSHAISDAHASLYAAEYLPYYMYRQKNTADNLENVGFSKKGKECLYNIDMMEETATVYGAGAGAVGKRICDGGRIERISNPKGFREYLTRIDSVLERKEKFYSPRT